MLTESEKLDVLLRLSQELGQSKDLDILMEHILTEARRFVNADAGSIYLRDNGSLVFSLHRTIPCNGDSHRMRSLPMQASPSPLIKQYRRLCCKNRISSIYRMWQGYRRRFHTISTVASMIASVIPRNRFNHSSQGV